MVAHGSTFVLRRVKIYGQIIGMVKVQHVWRSAGNLIDATGETIVEVASMATNVSKRVINGARRIGNSWVSHTNKVLARSARGSKRARKGSRRGTRRSRRKN